MQKENGETSEGWSSENKFFDCVGNLLNEPIELSEYCR